MAKLIVLALQQVMQRQRLRRPVRAGAIGGKAALYGLGAAFDVPQLGFESRRLLAIGVTQSLVARGEVEDESTCFACFRACFPDDDPQYLAIALRRDRQAMLEIPA